MYSATEPSKKVVMRVMKWPAYSLLTVDGMIACSRECSGYFGMETRKDSRCLEETQAWHVAIMAVRVISSNELLLVSSI